MWDTIYSSFVWNTPNLNGAEEEKSNLSRGDEKMFVDAKGDAAHVLFRMSGEPSEITPWRGSHRILQ
jgi:hypothetical protein